MKRKCKISKEGKEGRRKEESIDDRCTEVDRQMLLEKEYTQTNIRNNFGMNNQRNSYIMNKEVTHMCHTEDKVSTWLPELWELISN